MTQMTRSLFYMRFFFFFFFFWGGGGGGVLVKSYAISAKHAFKGNLKACYKVRQLVITSL